MTNINKRVEQLIAKVAMSKASFSKATGISTVILSHISSGRNKVSLTAVEQIIMAYPNVSTEWLLLGKGQMFKDGIEDESTTLLYHQIASLHEELERSSKSLTLKLGKIKDTLDDISGKKD